MSCAICGKPVEKAYKPFCSRRCADVDLARWLNGSYAIPVPPDDPDAEADQSGQDPRPH
jgi:endogenous inhibitor of DNA gyrase (YacG/DUF329 family)